MAPSGVEAREYLERHHVPFYLRDVIALLLQTRTERPLEFVAEYFAEVLEGKNVLCREFEYVNGSTHNRWSFIVSSRETFAGLDATQPTSNLELLQLLQLVCPDFPPRLVNEAAKLCGRVNGPHALGKLMHATFACLYFSEFLRWTAGCFDACRPDNRGLADLASLVRLLTSAARSEDITFSIPPVRVYDELLTVLGEGEVSLFQVQQGLLSSRAVAECIDPSCSPRSDPSGAACGSHGASTSAASPGTDANFKTSIIPHPGHSDTSQGLGVAATASGQPTIGAKEQLSARRSRTKVGPGKQPIAGGNSKI
ncbi:hypothetical protein AB1Y20_003684 [Prymnesium parvum]|uniref:Centriolar satellite-associated tubulin polyglutamylase complex regulator 1 n=1 Tax=Prymnesium parvum TaxID=97485 RepID=A0AB34J7Y7_PRYPA